MAAYVQPDSWRGVTLEDYASEQAKKGARPKSSVLSPERVSTGLSPVPEDASSRQLDVGPVGVSRPADDDDDDDAASMRSGASRASSATYSVASLGSVISSDDMVTVRVRERRTGHMREYHVRRGTDVKDARSRGVRRISRAWIGAAAGRGEVRAGQREDDVSHEGAVPRVADVAPRASISRGSGVPGARGTSTVDARAREAALAGAAPRAAAPGGAGPPGHARRLRDHGPLGARQPRRPPDLRGLGVSTYSFV